MEKVALYRHRERIGVLVLAILLVVTILQTWAGSSQQHTTTISPRHTMEVALFNWVARVMIGSRSIADRQALANNGNLPETVNWIREPKNFASYLERVTEETPDSEQVGIGKTILAGHLGLRPQYAELRARAGRELSDLGVDLLGLIDKIYGQSQNEKALDAEYLLDVAPLVEEELGWIGKILVADGLKTFDQGRAEKELEKLYSEARQKAIIFGIMFCFGIVFLIAGFISFLVYLIKFAFADITLKGPHLSIPAPYLLDIFILYLVALNLLFWAAGLFIESLSMRLPISAVGTLALTLLIFYPKVRGSGIRNTLTSIGLSPLPSFGTILSGPLFVAAMWPLFALLVGLYQTALTRFGFDLSQGEHPVVPVFLASNSTFALLWLFIFASVIAPIVEEIMFRGVLYGWLRSRYGKLISILSSAFMFAVIHPQGALGIIPLSLIGCGLAFIREWRGSLIPCMAAHALVNGTVLAIIFQLR